MEPKKLLESTEDHATHCRMALCKYNPDNKVMKMKTIEPYSRDQQSSLKWPQSLRGHVELWDWDCSLAPAWTEMLSKWRN